MLSRMNSRDGNVPNSACRFAPGAAGCATAPVAGCCALGSACAVHAITSAVSAMALHAATLETFIGPSSGGANYTAGTRLIPAQLRLDDDFYCAVRLLPEATER